jgi:hypothetical protein
MIDISGFISFFGAIILPLVAGQLMFQGCINAQQKEMVNSDLSIS